MTLKISKSTFILSILLSCSVTMNAFLLIERLTIIPSPTQYARPIIIEIKCWIDLNGTFGYEAIPMAKITPLNSKVTQESYNWIIGDLSPLKLDNHYGYKIIAPPERHGKKFLFWQSEKTGLIIPNRTLTLKPGFEPDCWWQNYG